VGVAERIFKGGEFIFRLTLGRARLKPLNRAMLTATVLECANVRHGFLSRKGGVSQGVYASLNCGPGSADDAGAVVENRRRAVSRAGLEGAPLVTCYQVHSADVVQVTEPWDPAHAPKADALVTNQTGIAIGVLTADCAPVLFCDVQAGVVGAAHAGWKGAQGGVLEATVREMVRLGAKAQNIRAAVGPCIHQISYEVGGDLCKAVLTASDWALELFEPAARAEHYQFDLPGYVSGRLARMDLGHIEVLAFDTYGDENQFFSYRRTTHQGGGDYGRLLSVIGMGA